MKTETKLPTEQISTKDYWAVIATALSVYRKRKQHTTPCVVIQSSGGR